MLNLIPAFLSSSPRRRYLLFDQTSSVTRHPDSSRKPPLQPGQGGWPQQFERHDAPRGGVEPGPRVGAGADLVEVWDRCPMRPIAGQRAPEVGLIEAGRTGVDVAANEARIAALELGRGQDGPAGDGPGEVVDLARQPRDDAVGVGVLELGRPGAVADIDLAGRVPPRPVW